MQPQPSYGETTGQATIINIRKRSNNRHRASLIVCVVVAVVSLGIGWSQQRVADEWRREVTERDHRLDELKSAHEQAVEDLEESQEQVLDLTARLDELTAKYAALQDPP